MAEQDKKLLDRVRDKLRLKHYAYRTEQTYIHWIKRYIYFHDIRHPKDMGAAEVEAFLTHLFNCNWPNSSTSKTWPLVRPAGSPAGMASAKC